MRRGGKDFNLHKYCDYREIMSQGRSRVILSFSWRRRNTPPFRDTGRI